MKQAILSAIALACLWSTSHAATITYQLEQHPEYQNGFTLSGSITTDGTMGQIVQGNIMSWNWSVSKGSVVMDQLSSSDLNAEAAPIGLIASSTTLTIPEPVSGEQRSLLLCIRTGIGIGGGVSNILEWINGNGPGTGDIYSANPQSPEFWNYGAPSPMELNMGDGTTFLIASVATQAVPEPASLVMMSLGVAAVVAMAWRHSGFSLFSRAARISLSSTRQ